ncbi:hypothetical protein NE237_006915 [Protea cynaroides]|uniref:Uncharacterized protein n=1 Tax=Protea cynaroides TaxID=273540 RepID=A0A9Q0KNZ6_9MAGN|nr:hypothetical protein NE237_006915 [Protea cynaroides]
MEIDRIADTSRTMLGVTDFEDGFQSGRFSFCSWSDDVPDYWRKFGFCRNQKFQSSETESPRKKQPALAVTVLERRRRRRVAAATATAVTMEEEEKEDDQTWLAI